MKSKRSMRGIAVSGVAVMMLAGSLWAQSPPPAEAATGASPRPDQPQAVTREPTQAPAKPAPTPVPTPLPVPTPAKPAAASAFPATTRALPLSSAAPAIDAGQAAPASTGTALPTRASPVPSKVPAKTPVVADTDAAAIAVKAAPAKPAAANKPTQPVAAAAANANAPASFAPLPPPLPEAIADAVDPAPVAQATAVAGYPVETSLARDNEASSEILVEPGAVAPIPMLSAPDLEAYVDGLVPLAIARGGLAGAVVVVVRDGQVLLAKGYGYADVEKRKPMDAARTLVRPGSISKLFVWTAAMQLVEQGKLDLDADVNRYLDFKIRDYAGQPATMRQLMTHSAGFEESAKHLFAADESRLLPLDRYLKQVQPERVYAPGKVPAYSNYGAALAAYVVQRISKQAFDDYIEANVLVPLRMRQSSFRQPLPKGLAGDMAKSYSSADGAPIPFELVNPAPAGSLSATGLDMARFMIAQLDERGAGAATILQPHSLQTLHAAASRPIPGLDAMALGFFRRDTRGPVVIGHGGATEAFQSNLVLLPAHGLGLFVSADGPGSAGRALHRDLIKGVIQRYFPVRGAQQPTLPTARLHAEQLVGRYENSRASSSNFLAIARLLGSAKIGVNDDDTLSVSAFRTPDGRPKRWREVEPYVWREVGGDSLLAAKLVGNEVIAVSSDDVPAAMWLQPVPDWRSPGWMLPLLCLVLAVQALALLLWPVAALVRRHFQRPLVLAERDRRLRLLSFLGLIGNLVLVLLWLWIITRIDASVRMLDGALDPWIRVAQLLGLASMATAVVAVLNARAVWRSSPQRLRRVCAIAVAAACVAMVWYVLALRTLSWSLVY
ncbi:serine hydrolase [Lysobacter antibioticus]|uniref:Beta-lactamase family protein n=1 Tax=Lysobacter antibioticus TaxID=84531 RepID=A0A0S2F4D5_LYSAN|nr:serine hydrolase [Lysobacter antibioticus]ALN78428.1 beta-lactamase family protein [Lysobacter antibioticus]